MIEIIPFQEEFRQALPNVPNPPPNFQIAEFLKRGVEELNQKKIKHTIHTPRIMLKIID